MLLDNRKTIECVPISNDDLIARYAKHAQAFAEQQPLDAKAFFVLPIDSDDWLDFGQIAVAAQAINGHHPNYGSRSLQIQAVLLGGAKRLEILAGNPRLLASQQAEDVFGRLFQTHDAQVGVTRLSYDFSSDADVKRLDTPEDMRPLQLYSVTGGKLAQLLL